MITLVAAMGRRWVIGRGIEIPWKIPGDLQHFKALTLEHAVVMGRTTWEAVGRPLPRRTNVVLSRDDRFAPEGALVARGFDEALALSAQARPGAEVMVIGGAKIYALALPRADRMVLTVVQGDFAGDVFFPRFEPGAWACVGHTVHEVSARDAHRWAVFDWRREGLDDAASRAAWMQSLGPDT